MRGQTGDFPILHYKNREFTRPNPALLFIQLVIRRFFCNEYVVDVAFAQ